MTKFIGIIPARFASTRFPGKPLAKLGEKTVIERVVEQASKALDEVYVATDDQRIADEVARFGGKAIMTSPNHKSGTDRIAEAFEKTDSDADVIINVQGDEPFIHPLQIEALKKCFDDPTTDIATLALPFDASLGFEELFNPNKVKVIFSPKGNAIYFSRSIIPYIRGTEWQQWLDKHTFYTHIGMYAYRANVLSEITQLNQSELEKCESLEQLRWLENGYRIKVGITDRRTVGIDTPEDLEKARLILEENDKNIN